MFLILSHFFDKKIFYSVYMIMRSAEHSIFEIINKDAYILHLLNHFHEKGTIQLCDP